MQFQKWWMRPCPFLWCLSAPREVSCWGLREVSVPGGRVQSPGSVHVLPIPGEDGCAVPRWAHGAGTAAGAALALAFLPPPPSAVLGGAPPVGADGRAALCENGFDSPSLCHFKLVCNGFPWEEGRCFASKHHPGHCKKPQALLLLQPNSI